MSTPQQIESSTKKKIRSLPIEVWLKADRTAWMSAASRASV
jgi:hypothetical protein